MTEQQFIFKYGGGAFVLGQVLQNGHFWAKTDVEGFDGYSLASGVFVN
jgi:hypothetical protein